MSWVLASKCWNWSVDTHWKNNTLEQLMGREDGEIFQVSLGPCINNRHTCIDVMMYAIYMHTHTHTCNENTQVCIFCIYNNDVNTSLSVVTFTRHIHMQIRTSYTVCTQMSMHISYPYLQLPWCNCTGWLGVKHQVYPQTMHVHSIRFFLTHTHTHTHTHTMMQGLHSLQNFT